MICEAIRKSAEKNTPAGHVDQHNSGGNKIKIRHLISLLLHPYISLFKHGYAASVAPGVVKDKLALSSTAGRTCGHSA